ncbi:PREDICTED: uncharacterized protein LOC104824118 isoform X3 [Tarenaya hassleriana]|uniref:uncharacterized protein LOC104824118 isoform X3 n=1 Tax=Tarenaya hassleriana TaxID=28532 RepID=UPI00053C7092|nr:PREDICTED: uncharacterized protein LOC104824118 isoform X3 [Tarenaya hassleriana]
MAMPPGSVIQSEKTQFRVAPASAAAAPPPAPGGGHWIPDERDEFILWLWSESPAANAIIDLLCQHLHAVEDPGEYDTVLAGISQRRYNWTPVLHMQQYFPVADVVYSLQQIAWMRQTLPPLRHSVLDQGKFRGREFRRLGPVFYELPGGQRGSEAMVKDGQNLNSDFHSVDRFEKREEARVGGRWNRGKDMDDNAFAVLEEKRDDSENLEANSGNSKASWNSEESEIFMETQAGIVNHNSGSKVSLLNKSRRRKRVRVLQAQRRRLL